MNKPKTRILDESKVYVVHAPMGYDAHEQHIKRHFAEQGIGFEFISEEDLDTEGSGPVDFADFFTPGIVEKSSKGALFCTLSHIAACQKLVAGKEKYALVFEDDAWLSPGFSEKLEKMHAEIASRESGFMISLENTSLKSPSFFQAKRGKCLYRAVSGRMAGGYIIDQEGAKRCLEYIEKNRCSDIIDWWHNTLSTEGIMTIYWAHPTLVEQGSHNGKMFAGISSRPATYSRRIIWIFSKLYKMTLRRLFKQKNILDD